jgi:hypothetical protein
MKTLEPRATLQSMDGQGHSGPKPGKNVRKTAQNCSPQGERNAEPSMPAQNRRAQLPARFDRNWTFVVMKE